MHPCTPYTYRSELSAQQLTKDLECYKQVPLNLDPYQMFCVKF